MTELSKSNERSRRAAAKAAGGPRGGKSAPRATKGSSAGKKPGSAARDGAGPGPHEVRIIGGQWKRTRLPVADRPGLRPTPGRVRETLFNWLLHLSDGTELTGWRCLDAFAGTGALGFEAASRGASEVVLVERDAQLVKTLKLIQEKLKATTVRCEVADALAWMGRSPPGRFDVVFLDPPFDADDLFAPSLKAALRLLAPNGVIYLEGPRACDPVAVGEMGLTVLRQGKAGAVHYHLLQAASER